MASISGPWAQSQAVNTWGETQHWAQCVSRSPTCGPQQQGWVPFHSQRGKQAAAQVTDLTGGPVLLLPLAPHLLQLLNVLPVHTLWKHRQPSGRLSDLDLHPTSPGQELLHSFAPAEPPPPNPCSPRGLPGCCWGSSGCLSGPPPHTALSRGTWHPHCALGTGGGPQDTSSESKLLAVPECQPLTFQMGNSFEEGSRALQGWVMTPTPISHGSPVPPTKGTAGGREAMRKGEGAPGEGRGGSVLGGFSAGTRRSRGIEKPGPGKAGCVHMCKRERDEGPISCGHGPASPGLWSQMVSVPLQSPPLTGW